MLKFFLRINILSCKHSTLICRSMLCEGLCAATNQGQQQALYDPVQGDRNRVQSGLSLHCRVSTINFFAAVYNLKPYIISSQCSYTFFFFRLSGICKHVAALLYTVSDMVEEGLNTPGTSRQQTWHQPSSTVTKSAFVVDISTPKASPSMEVVRKPRRDEFDPRPKHLQRVRTLDTYDLDELAEISNGKAAVLMYAGLARKQDTKSVPNLSHVVSEEVRLNLPSVEEMVSRDEEVKVSPEIVEFIREETVDQSKSALWYEQRNGRITASNVGLVMNNVNEKKELGNATHTAVCKVMGYYKCSEDKLPESLKWGREREAYALRAFKSLKGKIHPGKFTLNKTGLWISPSHPFLAASPDGLLDCECCDPAVVEVK